MPRENNEQEVLAELEQQMTPEMENAGVLGAKAGEAQFRIVNTYLSRSQKGNKQDNWQVEVIGHDSDPASVGEKILIRYQMEFSKDIKQLQRYNTALANLGIEGLKKANDVLRIHKDLENVCFNGTIVPNKDSGFGPNVYINAGARRRDLEGQAGKMSNSPAAANQPSAGRF